MGNATPSEYVLGVNDAELARLGFQHQLWSETAHACWERAAMAPGLTVLDIGCGPGFAAFDMAQIVGEGGRIIALDQAERFLEHVRAQAAARGLPQIEPLRGEATALARAGVRPASVDIAYARWCLCFVDGVAGAVREAAAALRPGGRLCVHDYFNYESMRVAPASAAFGAVIRAVAKSWRDRGGDPDVMGTLPRLCADAGLEVSEFRPLQRIARPGDQMWQWPTVFFRNYVPELEKMGLLTAPERKAFEDDWSARSADRSTWIFLPPMFELIAVKR